MKNLFKHLPDIDAISYTDYYLNNLFVENNSYEELIEKPYISFDFPELNQGMTKHLNEYLMSTYNFPAISYALVFKHSKDQPIHVDGTNPVRYASLNLPLIGYENTKMVFYKSILKIEDIVPIDAFYFPKDAVEYYSELPGSNDWVLVNSSVPHHIVNSNPDNPRMTICFRFKNNPTFEFLTGLIDFRHK